MVREHAGVGGRKAAEIEYELHRYVIAVLGDNKEGNMYADYAVRELKFGAEWIRVFADGKTNPSLIFFTYTKYTSYTKYTFKHLNQVLP
jgi:hypothetical protein